MLVLVTGGGGFIGSHLVPRLLEAGHDVRVLDNFATGHRWHLQGVMDDIELVEGDIQSSDIARAAVRGCEVIFHQAALRSIPRSIDDPMASNAINSVGTLNLLVAARDQGTRRFVYASSSSVYGANPALPRTEDLRTDPISPYAVAKLASEGFCRAFSEVYGLETLTLRYFNVFGPRQDPKSKYAAVIPKFITSVLAGERPVIYGDGSQSRDFTYIDNVIKGNMQALEAPVGGGEQINLACGDRITLRHLVDSLERITGRSIAPVHEDPRPGDVLHAHASIERAEALLGYRPVVGFEEGLERTVAFFAEGLAARSDDVGSFEAAPD